MELVRLHRVDIHCITGAVFIIRIVIPTSLPSLLRIHCLLLPSTHSSLTYLCYTGPITSFSLLTSTSFGSASPSPISAWCIPSLGRRWASPRRVSCHKELNLCQWTNLVLFPIHIHQQQTVVLAPVRFASCHFCSQVSTQVYVPAACDSTVVLFIEQYWGNMRTRRCPLDLAAG